MASRSSQQESPNTSASARRGLTEFLKRNRPRAIAEWEHAVRGIPAAALLDRDELRDHIPLLIERLLELVEAPEGATVGDLPDRHAIERFQEGFNLEQVAWEYSALRSTLLRLNEEEGNTLSSAAIVLLNDAIDRAVVRAVSKFHRARVRTLEALDRIAQEGLLIDQEGLLAEPEALDSLLERLLRVILDCADSVDTAVLYLCEWDRLVLRAAVGLEQDLKGKFSVAFGEGFAGAVARTRRPLLSHSAESDPVVRNPLLRMTGVKALYGVPLVYGDSVIGVAKMGSRTVSDFAPEDRQILRSSAERAAAFIAHRRISEERELLLHILGHDLRSPLNTIVFSAKSLERREPLSAEGVRDVERVLSAGERMGRLISDLTDYTRTRATGSLSLDREELDLGDLVAQIAREVQARSGRELHVDAHGDLAGEWDRGRILRVIVNLVDNAFAYGAPSTPVTVSVEGEDAWVTMSVHNEGEPITADVSTRLFEAFKRGTKGAGSGLGLYIVQQIARAHGGSVEVHSAAGHGTTFRVRLPRRAPAPGR
ncbi:MAG TPA: ATP-binding protein [Polyangiaceae bacterium]|nr:ATP-binding protein [Polyangiaceae bacterium]